MIIFTCRELVAKTIVVALRISSVTQNTIFACPTIKWSLWKLFISRILTGYLLSVVKYIYWYIFIYS